MPSVSPTAGLKKLAERYMGTFGVKVRVGIDVLVAKGVGVGVPVTVGVSVMVGVKLGVPVRVMVKLFVGVIE